MIETLLLGQWLFKYTKNFRHIEKFNRTNDVWRKLHALIFLDLLNIPKTIERILHLLQHAVTN